MILKYNVFRNNTKKDIISINENLNRAKKLMRETTLIEKIAKELDFIDDEMNYEIEQGIIKTLTLNNFSTQQANEIKKRMSKEKLSKKEIEYSEKNVAFAEIRKILGQNLGYMYTFTYMHFVENNSLDNIKEMFEDVMRFKNLLNKFPKLEEVGKKFDANFIDTSLPNQKESRNNSEILVDGLTVLKNYQKVKKILDELPKSIRKQYDDSPKEVKDGLLELANAFDNVPKSFEQRIWKNFFGEVSIDNNELLQNGDPNPNYGKERYMSRLYKYTKLPKGEALPKIIEEGKKYVNSSTPDTNDYDDRIGFIKKAQKKFGNMGATILYDENGVIIIEVYSYVANNFLNEHTSHCIQYNESHWNSYVGDINKQYYYYDTNVSKSENLSTIGITIQPDGTFKSDACQNTPNHYVGDKIYKIFENWEKKYDLSVKLKSYLKPISKDELTHQQVIKTANINISKENISIDKLKEYVNDGANINNSNGKALLNSLKENNLEKIKFSLENGASPNINKEIYSFIGVDNKNILLLLLENGLEINTTLINKISTEIDILKEIFRKKYHTNSDLFNLLTQIINNNNLNFDNIDDNIINEYLEIYSHILDIIFTDKKYKNKIKSNIDLVMFSIAQSNHYQLIDFIVNKGYYKLIPYEVIDESFEFMTMMGTFDRDDEFGNKIKNSMEKMIELKKKNS